MIYFFDGSTDGFLCAFLTAFSDPEARLTSTRSQIMLGEEVSDVTPDRSKALKVQNRFLQLDSGCLQDLDFLLRSSVPDHEQIAYCYLKEIAKRKRPIRDMLHLECVINATETIRKVTYEIHRMHGFLRFMESKSGALYAPISPDNDICDLLTPHFVSRMPQHAFVIHDVKRKKASVYDGKNQYLIPLAEADVVLETDEKDWQRLWKNYYSDVYIPERKREQQMKNYMPVRYWKFMPEKQR